jgi:hypothetical protein
MRRDLAIMLTDDRSDRAAGLAVAGFVCGLLSVMASLLAALLASGALPGGTSGEGLLVLIAAGAVAFVGLPLSFLGRHSTSRRRWALPGMVFSALTLILLALVLVMTYLSWSTCANSCV